MGRKASRRTKEYYQNRRAYPHLERKPDWFECQVCFHLQSCSIGLDKAKGIATISCYNCNVQYCTRINYLTETIDVHAQWVDEMEGEE